MSIEDDTYSNIFTALKHPIRRKILRILNQTPATYTDIQTQLGIDNGLLNYHLDNMKDLINKGEEGKYGLSEFGRAALSVTEKVEAPAKKSNGLSVNQQNGVILILTIAVASLSGLSFLLYSNYMGQGGVLSEKVAELNLATKQLTVLARALWLLDPTVPLRLEHRVIIEENKLSLVTLDSENQSVSSYEIEKMVGGIWELIPFKPNSHLVEIDQGVEKIDITGLDSGTYRVGRRTISSEAQIEFIVRRPEQDPNTRPLYGFRPIFFYENWKNGLQTLELANMGARTLLIGSEYRLEKKTGGVWVAENNVTDAGPPLKLESGGIYRQSFQLPLGEGEYRYTKEVRVEDSSWVETLAFPYIEGADVKVYTRDPEPNLRSNEFTWHIPSGPYTTGDEVPFKVQHLGGSGEENLVSFKYELIKAENLMVISKGAMKSLQTYETRETKFNVPFNATMGTYYFKLTASDNQRSFSTVTQVVQIVEFEKLPLSPVIRMMTDPPNSRIFYLTIENMSPRKILVWKDYTLEKQTDGGWLFYPLNDTSKNEYATISSGGFSWQRFDFSGLETGDYHIVALVKYLNGEPQKLYTEFHVE